MKIQNEALFKHSLLTGINLFLGAGFSLEASSMGKPLPVGDNLKLELLTHFNRDKSSQLNLAQLCQIISSTQKDELIKYFNDRFRISDFNSTYLNLDRVNIKSIFTTNIDDLIFHIFEDSSKYYINDIMLRGPAIAGSNAIDYIALHGSITHGDNKFDFSPVEISSSFERDKDKWFGYISRIQSTPTLYWGYRIQDAGVLQALAKETISGRNKAEAWIVLREDDDETIEYYASLGFQTIIADTIQLLNYIGQLKVNKEVGGSKSLVNKNFKEYLLPSISNVPVRSISEFYLGSDPTWYDVFSGRIHQTEYFFKAKNIIFGDKSLLLIGGAVTGKSTLLKQLATDLSENTAVLYIEEMTPEKATLLIRDIDAEGKPVLMFIDNAADSSDAIRILEKSCNIKIIAAERDYIYDSVSYKFSNKNFEILDVSGLSEIDIQSIQNNIPNDVQKKAYRKTNDPLSADSAPTFLEVLTAVITANSLTDRFIQALVNFKETNPVNHDLLLMVCYLYTCRIPTSIDVSTAFARSHSLSAIEVLQRFSSMGSLLSSYEGALADTNQAFYVPRSRTVAETVMHRVSSSNLRRLLEVFLEEVSPTKISRFDIFKRGAYDAKLVSRAFPNWQEGLEFYNQAFIKDSSYSLKQQGALYLASKKNYELAFTWIDEASSMTTKHNPTVRNTYAIILFEANYDKPLNQNVISTLDESMEILEKCHHIDSRKIYHAKIFAEQALKYSKKFPSSSNARKYLAKSEEWLIEELKVRTGDRKMISLLRNIKQEIIAL
ncbi:MAG: SIR2 family protein [Methylotenera sp.]